MDRLAIDEKARRCQCHLGMNNTPGDALKKKNKIKGKGKEKTKE
jgi:hypothetical protein